MRAQLIVLSDLHMGYDLSLFNDPGVQDRAIGILAGLCDGAADRLILNGDCFEACVPEDAGVLDASGFSPRVTSVARGFFARLVDKITVKSLVIVWGNHDLAMGLRLAAACEVPVFTNNLKGDVLLQSEGQVLAGAAPFLEAVVGPARARLNRVRVAYPNYVLGTGWPYLVFHHGHFLDDLVLGLEDPLKYAGLVALTGQGRPRVDVAGDETVRSLHDKTVSFLSSLYAYDSHARKELWAIIRRGDAGLSCPHSLDFYKSVLHDEVLQDGLGKHTRWYCDLLMADPTTPPPIGASKFQSYLFVGHDHRGGSRDVVAMDGKPWTVVNTGGWTTEGGCRTPHKHAVVWSEGHTEPGVYCL